MGHDRRVLQHAASSFAFHTRHVRIDVMLGPASRAITLAIATAALAGCPSAARTSTEAPRPSGDVGADAPVPRADNARARALLCSDVGDAACLASCPDDVAWRAHVECLVDLRFASDPDARELARRLFARTGIVPGIEEKGAIDGYHGAAVELLPALPLGDDRRHLAWLTASFDAYDAFLAAIAARAPRPVTFFARASALRFYRTEPSSFPSAYVLAGTIGYNLEGPLHTNADDVRETLFHELFHVNDEARGAWSQAALGPVYDTILARCGDDHECFTPFAPHDTVVADGTFYAFDERTRDVREYGAELALRYYREHEAILGSKDPVAPPFKCLAEENRIAWERLRDDFFGGVDLSAECSSEGG
jgi:hypothetical protein